jgi:predicted CopG family antitoxin
MQQSAVETRLPVSSGLRDELRSMKRGAETYEDVLWHLLELAKRHCNEFALIGRLEETRRHHLRLLRKTQ